MIVLALLLSAAAADCSRLAVPITPALQRKEAKGLSALSGQKIRPAGVSRVLAERNWRIVFATPVDAERGVFVLRRIDFRYRLIDIWGGVLAAGERGEAARWARALRGGGVPPRLARCMDEAIAGGA